MSVRLTPLAGATMPAAGDLRALVGDVWTRIGNALDGKWPLWALPTVATSGPSGPRARVVALRGADPATRTLVFHGDARSDKVHGLLAEPRTSVVFWDPVDGIEARFTGNASVHIEDELALAAWRNVSPLRRLASRTIAAPGAPLRDATRFDALPLRAEDQAAGNFAVMRVEVARLDWLWVGADDMRRATFDWNAAGWAGVWTIP